MNSTGQTALDAIDSDILFMSTEFVLHIFEVLWRQFHVFPFLVVSKLSVLCQILEIRGILGKMRSTEVNTVVVFVYMYVKSN